MLLVMGVVFFIICFLLFLDLFVCLQPENAGREDKVDEMVTEANSNTEEGLTQLATSYIAAVGGTDNLKTIDVYYPSAPDRE